MIAAFKVPDAPEKKREYIGREAALEIAMRYCPDDDGACSNAGDDLREMLDELEAIPAADVRPVVLCRDCKHSAIDLENMRYCKCVVYYNHVPDDWFCADGVKREEN